MPGITESLIGLSHPGAVSDHRAQHLLEGATSLLRLPTSPDQPPEVLPDGTGIRCPITCRTFPYRDGVLGLLGDGLQKTLTQHVLDTSLTAWAYDRFRGLLTRLLSSPEFPVEVVIIQQTLQVRAGDTILDLACGQGNFTVEWAKRVGQEGLVIGLDISPPMLARAATTSPAGDWTTCCSSVATHTICPSLMGFCTR
jgi:hypothetical protein